MFGITPTPQQQRVLQAVAKHNRVAVRSGHKCGKSMTAALLAWWWVHRYKDMARVVITATTNHQVRTILWREIKRLKRLSRIPMPDVAELPAIGVQWPDGRSIEGFSTDEAEKMAGLSSPHMLFLVDEASGVTEAIWEAIEGNRAGGAHVLAISNPTQPAGTFYDAFHSKGDFWHTIHISSTEAANYDVPGLATKEWCEEKLREWGPASPLYQVRVAGDFAEHAEATVIPLLSVTAAQERYADSKMPAHLPLEVGVDPARFGDDETVIAARRGHFLFPLRSYPRTTVTQVAEHVLKTIEDYHKPGEAPAVVRIDTIGVGGGVADVLRSRATADATYSVVDINVSNKAILEDKYSNLRAEMWFNLGSWTKSAAIPPTDDALAADMMAPRYEFDSRDRLRVEKKDDIKRRLNRSPDRAEAVMLAVWSDKQPLVVNPHAGPTAQPHAVYMDQSRFSGFGRGF